MAKKESAEKAVRDIRRKTRRRFSAEEKIRIVIEGLRGEESIASLCRRSAGSVLADVYPRTRTAQLANREKRGPRPILGLEAPSPVRIRLCPSPKTPRKRGSFWDGRG